MPNMFESFVGKVKELIYKPQQKYLTPEEADAVAAKVKKARITMQSNCSWAAVQVKAALKDARANPKGTPHHQHYLRLLRLRLVMQQYLTQMSLAMESIDSQIKLAQISAEMGTALNGATRLVNTYKRDMTGFTGFVRDFMKAIGPMNDALGGGLDEMTRALDELCGCSLDGIYSDEALYRLINEETTAIEPEIPARPEASQKPADADLLASIEEQMRIFHGEDSKQP